MDNQTQNTSIGPSIGSSTGPSIGQKRSYRILFIVLLALVVLVLGYFGYTNPDLFRASVLETGTSQPPPSVYLYTPDYTANSQDSGTISIKTTTIGPNVPKDIAGQPIPETAMAVGFKLKYSPTDALQFDDNAVVFASDTIFKSADMKIVNTKTPGEIKVSLLNNAGVALIHNTKAANSKEDNNLLKLNLKINAKPGTTINLTFDEVEVVTQAGGNISASVNYKSIQGSVIRVNAAAAQDNLRVNYAENLGCKGGACYVLIEFSDLLQQVGAPGDYIIQDPVLAQLKVQLAQSGYLHPEFASKNYKQNTVILKIDPYPANAGYNLYNLEIKDGLIKENSVRGNAQGYLTPIHRKAFFEGYLTPPVDASPVILEKIDVNSGTELVLNFSGDVKDSTLTPVNVVIRHMMVAQSSSTTSGSGVNNPPPPPAPVITTSTVEAKLTVTKIEKIDGKTYRVTTAPQFSDNSYFVSFSQVQDATGKTLINNRILNFFGFASPVSVSQVAPSTITNDKDQEVVLKGQNLDQVKTVRLGANSIVIVSQTSTEIKATVPKSTAAGIYEMTLETKTGDIKTMKDALVITAFIAPLRIVSEESRAIPNRVNPDGKTKVTFWVLLEDPVDISSVTSVTMDLEPIGGQRAQELTKDTGLQKKNQQFYTYSTTVSANTPTKAEPYKLKVQARKGADVVDGTVDIIVTKDLLASVAPTIDQVYVTPATLPPDGKTKGKISAKITDKDGADTIKSVVADLGPAGAGFVLLKKVEISSAVPEQLTAFFESPEFTIPSATKFGTYKINPTASDDTGESTIKEIDLQVMASVSGPSIDSAKSYISPRKSIPKGSDEKLSVNAMITDPDGVSDIDSVMGYAGSLGIKPLTLVKAAGTSESSKTALYSSEAFTVPATAPMGMQDIEIVAVDKSGAKASLILQLEISFKDTLGSAPTVFSNKSYAMPKMVLNDGQTRVSLYAFVRDDDEDLVSVIVNLSKVGQVGPEVPHDLGAPPAAGASAGGACPTGSITIACMNPGFKEGKDGQWFMLPDVTISTRTPASSLPYELEVIATDKTGKVGRGKIPLIVGDSKGPAIDPNPPAILSAIPTGNAKIEVVFSKEMDAKTVSSLGKEFKITEREDISKTLSVYSAALNSAGNVVTLTTDAQISKKGYVLMGDKALQDVAASALSAGKGSRAEFTGYEESKKPPVVHYVSATDQETVEIGFQAPIKPSSLRLGLLSDRGSQDIEITEAEGSGRLPVLAATLLEGGTVLEVKTGVQKSAQRYRLTIKNVLSASGIALDAPAVKFFKAPKYSVIESRVVSGGGMLGGTGADLNGDGKVDFLDFTIFSSMYGKTITPSPQGTSPLVFPPDSTVPKTATPNS